MLIKTVGLCVFIVALAILNATVSILVAKDEYYEKWQKAAQVAIVWLLPGAGAIFVGILIRQQATFQRNQSLHSDPFEPVDLTTAFQDLTTLGD